jgi:hypothetical protein
MLPFGSLCFKALLSSEVSGGCIVVPWSVEGGA